MKWKIKNGMILDEHGKNVCMISEGATGSDIALIKNASDMFDAIMDYLQSIDGVTHPRNPKKHADKFKKIYERIVDESE